MEHQTEKDFNTARQTPPGTDWRELLDTAVTNTDEPKIWQIMAKQYENNEAHDMLANLVSRMAYETNGKPMYSEIFMVPIIADAGCNVIGNKAVWDAVSPSIRETVKGWFDDSAKTYVFEGVTWMDWVTTWSPTVLRGHLRRMMPGITSLKTEFSDVKINLPDDAPRMGLITIGRAGSRGWPELSPANALKDDRFKSVLKYGLQISAPADPSYMAPAPYVMTPERVQFAITDGVSMWLTRLNEVVGIKGWMLTPRNDNQDVMKITMRLDSEKVPITQFVLRLHQIGMQGLHDVVTVLSSLAPCTETPSDMDEPIPQKKLKMDIDAN